MRTNHRYALQLALRYVFRMQDLLPVSIVTRRAMTPGLLTWLLLCWTARTVWAFEPDLDKHVSLSPNNILDYGVTFDYFTNNSAAEIKIPRNFDHLPFHDATLGSTAMNRLLIIPVQPRDINERLLLSFWIDPGLLHDSIVTVRYGEQRNARGVAFHLPLYSFIENSEKPHNPPVRRMEKASDVTKAELPSWRWFLTITPEQIQAARSAPESRPADSDPDGHWGAPWEGMQLSIRLQKEVFTNGEPVIACVTLRNSSDTVRYFSVSTPQEERDTKIVLHRGQERVLGTDDPKSGESFQQRLKHVRSGSSHEEPLMPGTQRQFFRDLSQMFDLSLAGVYSAQAQRTGLVIERVPTMPGYIKGTSSNLLSGTVKFQVVGSRGPK